MLTTGYFYKNAIGKYEHSMNFIYFHLIYVGIMRIIHIIIIHIIIHIIISILIYF